VEVVDSFQALTSALNGDKWLAAYHGRFILERSLAYPLNTRLSGRLREKKLLFFTEVFQPVTSLEITGLRIDHSIQVYTQTHAENVQTGLLLRTKMENYKMLRTEMENYKMLGTEMENYKMLGTEMENYKIWNSPHCS
jgi:hypothetical protein